MSIIISYDIRDDKRLRGVAKYLESECIRVQKSVFLLPEAKRGNLKDIVNTVEDLMDKEDSVKVYKFEINRVISNYDIKDFIIWGKKWIFLKK